MTLGKEQINMNDADIAVIFKALADETRVKITEMLVGGERCACKILENLEITQPTLSYHMRILCESGIVIGRKDGAWMFYRLNQSRINAISRFFDILRG